MVHQYKLNGYNIVLDTCSGAIHVVDEVAYDIIELYQKKTPDEIIAEMMKKYGDREDVTEEELALCIEDVEGLVKAGKLYTEDTFEDKASTFK
ncbi:MAG: PqqD family peptide modification chaperone, partial [Firmicutes bacterium]|nr:PqqD family peptide modification chaperone [Bacillota bacterium]